MKTTYRILISLLIISLFLSACSDIGISQITNLPKGMQTGLWVSSNGDMGFALFKGGVMGLFKDGILGVGYEYGAYNLTSESTVNIKSGNNHNFALNIAVSQDGRKIIVESQASHLNDSFQLLIPDTSSGDIKKDLIGNWIQVNTTFTTTTPGNLVYQFGSDSRMTFASSAQAGNAVWDMIGDKLVITTTQNGVRKDTILHVASIGDLIMLYDPQSPVITLMRRQK